MAETVTWHPEASERWGVITVGAEPVVLYEYEHRVSRYHVVTSGWVFESPDGQHRLVLREGAVVGFSIPGQTLDGPPLEHGFVKIAGHTLSELRALATA